MHKATPSKACTPILFRHGDTESTTDGNRLEKVIWKFTVAIAGWLVGIVKRLPKLFNIVP
jgi:hypothetical protein